MGPERVRREDGFTLIELMVVVLILAILVTIGLPTFLGARSRAQNRAAQALIRQGLSTQIVHYGNAEAFTDDNANGGALDSIEPDIEWGSIDATVKGVTAYLGGGDDQVLILRSQSAVGTVYCMGRIEAGANAGTYFTTGCDGTEDEATVATWPSTLDAGWS